MSHNPGEALHEATGQFEASDKGLLLKPIGQKARERYIAARGKMREHWAEAKEDLGQFRQKAVEYSQSAAHATNTYAHDHPWRTAGAAVGIGALLGWLISRRSSF